MQILLMRHGKPQIDMGGRYSGKAFAEWIRRYDAAALDPARPPTQAAAELAAGCTCVVCSDMPRSLESAAWLGVAGEALLCDPLFREMNAPTLGLPWPRLTLKAWSDICRWFWLRGYASAQAESYASAIQRATQCAARLAALAQQHDKVLFVGHYQLNGFIAHALRRAGWTGPQFAAPAYWEYSCFEAARLIPRP